MMGKKELLNMGPQQIAVLLRCEFPGVAGLAAGSGDGCEFGRRLAEYAADRRASAGALERRAVSRAADRIQTLSQYEGQTVEDLSTGRQVCIRTLGLLRGVMIGQPDPETGSDLLLDMLHLLRALDGRSPQPPARDRLRLYARRWALGSDEEVQHARRRNRERIVGLLAERIEQRTAAPHKRFVFPEGASDGEKRALVEAWWGDFRFHLAMAIRSPRELNRYLDHSLAPEVMERLVHARRKGMPFFVTPYYASLLDTDGAFDDRTIRSYVLYSDELVNAYGAIRAWEREDEVAPGTPNAAGWMLPAGGNVHRRYPEVAIMIPDSMGRACGGLCAPCQRMYDFQRKHLGFDFNSLKPNEHWDAKLRRLMRWFAAQPDIRDILITGGDALMSQNSTLRNILDAVLRMAVLKRRAADATPAGQPRPATLDRIRLGSRIPAYLPMRIDDELISILADFGRRARQAGITQLVIQTHFESPLEMTPEAQRAVGALLSAGWLVTNQLVFTAAASRRGHSAALRHTLAHEGIVPYYTFTVKGFSENYALFAPNGRSLQEAAEEKPFGLMSPAAEEELMRLLEQPATLRQRLPAFMRRHRLPFISTDRNVLNLPGIGKSMTFQTVGVTPDGRRILRFEHDHGRRHSPVIDRMGDVFITENKSVAAYLRQLAAMGERISDYATLWDYAAGQTEPLFGVFRYPGQ